jgi:hypothetical protein
MLIAKLRSVRCFNPPGKAKLTLASDESYLAYLSTSTVVGERERGLLNACLFKIHLGNIDSAW